MANPVEIIIVEDFFTNSFTAYCPLFSEVIADGPTEIEAKENLIEIIKFYLNLSN